MKNLTITLLLLLSINTYAQSHKEVLRLNYDKATGILSNKDYTLQAVSFHHQEGRYYVNEKNYVNNIVDPEAEKDIYIYKFIVVRNESNGNNEIVEYWKRKDGSVLILYFMISENGATI